jgi:methanogenic corrinoid protein MtbC1
VEKLRRPPRGPELPGDGRGEWIERLLSPDPALAVDAALLAARSRADGWFDVAEALGGVLEEIGRRWEAGEISVLEEHVASARLARALSRAADALPVRPGAPRVLLATLEGEAHTLGLSLAELCVREAGWATLWSGRDTPVPELERLASRREVSVIALSASVCAEAAHLTDAAERIADACRAARVALILGGRGPWPHPPPSGRVLRSLGELRAWMPRFERDRSP